MPLPAMASAVARTTCSLRPSQANLFQLFQPIGGVRATPLSRACRAGKAMMKAVAAMTRKQVRSFMMTGCSLAVRGNCTSGVTAQTAEENGGGGFCAHLPAACGAELPADPAIDQA